MFFYVLIFFRWKLSLLHQIVGKFSEAAGYFAIFQIIFLLFPKKKNLLFFAFPSLSRETLRLEGKTFSSKEQKKKIFH